MILFGNYLDFSVEIAEVKSFFVPKSVSFFKGETIDFFPSVVLNPQNKALIMLYIRRDFFVLALPFLNVKIIYQIGICGIPDFTFFCRY